MKFLQFIDGEVKGGNFCLTRQDNCIQLIDL